MKNPAARTLICCFYFILPAIVPAGTGNQEWKAVPDRARDLMYRGLYQRASEMLSAFIQFSGFQTGHPENFIRINDEATRSQISAACLELAVCLMHLSKPGSALPVLNDGLVLNLADPRQNELCNQFRYQIGNCLAMLGERDRAIDIYQKLLCCIHKESHLYGEIFENLGSIYLLSEDYDKSIHCYQKAFISKHNRNKKNAGAMESLLINLGLACSKSNDDRGALKYLSMAAALISKSGKAGSLRMGHVQLSLGRLYLKTCKPDRALACFYKAKDICRSVRGNSPEENKLILENIATIHFQQGRIDSSAFYLKLAAEKTDPVTYNEDQFLVQIYLLNGKQFDEQNQYEKALSYYDSALLIVDPGVLKKSSFSEKIFIPGENLILQFHILENKARVLYKMSVRHHQDKGLLMRSFRLYYRAFQLSGLIEDDLTGESSLLLFNESVHSVLCGAFETGYLLYSKGYCSYSDSLFEIAEGSHGRILLAAIQREKQRKSAPLPDSVVLMSKALKKKITGYSSGFPGKQFAKFSGNEGFLKDLDILNDFYFRNDSLDGRIRQFCTQNRSNLGPDSVIRPDDLRKTLGGDEAMLYYFSADSTLFIMVLTRENGILKKVVLPGNFRKLIADYYRSLRSFEIIKCKDHGRRFYSLLVKPIEKYIIVKTRLLVIPPAEFSLIPFETLVKDSQSRGKDPVDENTDWLLFHFDIRYHFSASLWHQGILKDRSVRQQDEFSGFAPLTGECELPYAGEEITKVAELFRNKKGNANIYYGDSATKHNLESRICRPGIIHIATHGVTGSSFPGQSGVMFHNPGEEDFITRRSPDLISGNEFREMNVKADLLVLSACGTGSGKIFPEEGVLSLSRDCFYAGARNIVCTLWNIPDRSTSSFMVEFYRGILEGKDYALALRDAKIILLSRKETSIPFLWAPYILIGM